jgi:hypothetical protein
MGHRFLIHNRPATHLRGSLFAVLCLSALLCPLLALAQPAIRTAQVLDRPNDNGTGLLVTFSLDGVEGYREVRVNAEVQSGGVNGWLPVELSPPLLSAVQTQADMPDSFGFNPPHPDWYVLPVSRYYLVAEDGTPEPQDLVPGQEYQLQLAVIADGAASVLPLDSAAPTEQWMNWAALNSLLISVIFAVIIMSFIMMARKNPNLFIRRINGLEAVDDAIGRATEMGRPVLHLSGLDPLSTLSTIAAINILGRIARRVAHFDSDLLVPCFDPVVMTVSQEVVRNAYMEAGRPDAYRDDNVYFVTDQQFSYVAAVCGLMLREKPAANFLLGYYYAESLLLAETGFTTGAIQIAGTDSFSQLPFFVTTCDYTLIGEELYAASAYLSREPMLLGSLKGQDVGKAFVLLVILVGTILATIDALNGTNLNWISILLSPLA